MNSNCRHGLLTAELAVLRLGVKLVSLDAATVSAADAHRAKHAAALDRGGVPAVLGVEPRAIQTAVAECHDGLLSHDAAAKTRRGGGIVHATPVVGPRRKPHEPCVTHGVAHTGWRPAVASRTGRMRPQQFKFDSHLSYYERPDQKRNFAAGHLFFTRGDVSYPRDASHYSGRARHTQPGHASDEDLPRPRPSGDPSTPSESLHASGPASSDRSSK